MFVDNFLATQGSEYSGGIGEALGINGTRIAFDPGYRRPYIDKNGKLAVTINSFSPGGSGRTETVKGQRHSVREHRLVADLMNNHGVQIPTANATALRKEEWVQLDREVLRAARFRLQAWDDLQRANSFGGFNGMAKMVLEHETMSDPGYANVDMDAMTEGNTNASPKFQLEGLPLPITHSDFWFSQRKLAVSRNSGTPIDTTMAEAASRRVAESVEKTTVGNQTGLSYTPITQTGGYSRTASVYGYTNFSARLTRTFAGRAPSNAAWTASQTLNDVLACLDVLKANKFYGPFMIYHSNDWDRYMDGDYILTGGNVATQTLRERLKKIVGISDVKRLDFLFSAVPETNEGNTTSYKGPGGADVASAYPFTMIFVQMTQDVARAVTGMDITTVQWESKGGMQLNFKVMCIKVPQLRADHYGNCGILHVTFT